MPKEKLQQLDTSIGSMCSVAGALWGNWSPCVVLFLVLFRLSWVFSCNSFRGIFDWCCSSLVLFLSSPIICSPSNLHKNSLLRTSSSPLVKSSTSSSEFVPIFCKSLTIIGELSFGVMKLVVSTGESRSMEIIFRALSEIATFSLDFKELWEESHGAS